MEHSLSMNDYKAIVYAGTVSQEEARDKAYSEYDKFNNSACNATSDPDAPLLPFDINPTDG